MAKIKFRRDTAAAWTEENPTLAQGEPGFEHDTGLLKIGDGETAWTSLVYSSGGSGDSLVNGVHELTLESTGALLYPHNAVQRDTGTVECLGNASTVVYTASGQYQHTIRLLIQVEGNEGAPVGWDTQSCEMIIAKSFRANDIASTVYGIVHTSVAPLATFTAEWNALTNRVDVVCVTPSANSIYVRTFATEIKTAD
jgi:hypothetical protein